MIDPDDNVTRAILLVIAYAGFQVWVPRLHEGTIAARNEKTGEKFVVTADDPVDAVYELARQVGMELGD